MYISLEYRFTQAQSYWLALLLSTYLLFDTQKWDKYKILTEKEYKALYNILALNDKRVYCFFVNVYFMCTH